MQFDFNLAPGASQTIDVRGRFFKYKSGTGPIRVRTSLGGYLDLLPGQGVENVNFTSLTISDRSGAENIGTILAGEFDFRDDRIVGSVEVVDGGRSRTNARQAFTTHLYQGALAGYYSTLQLWNPAGSGKNIIVNGIRGYIAGGYDLQSKIINTEISTLGGAPVAGNIGCKKGGGGVGVAVAWQNAPTGIGGLPFSGPTFAFASGAITKPSEPWLIPPGWGLAFVSPVVNNACGADIEFLEESIL